MAHELARTPRRASSRNPSSSSCSSEVPTTRKSGISPLERWSRPGSSLRLREVAGGAEEHDHVRIERGQRGRRYVARAGHGVHRVTVTDPLRARVPGRRRPQRGSLAWRPRRGRAGHRERGIAPARFTPGQNPVRAMSSPSFTKRALFINDRAPYPRVDRGPPDGVQRRGRLSRGIPRTERSMPSPASPPDGTALSSGSRRAGASSPSGRDRRHPGRAVAQPRPAPPGSARRANSSWSTPGPRPALGPPPVGVAGQQQAVGGCAREARTGRSRCRRVAARVERRRRRPARSAAGETIPSRGEASTPVEVAGPAPGG